MYMPKEIRAKIILGIHTDNSGGVEPASAKVRNKVKNKIKMNDSTKPRAICSPVPPRLFREETITPIKTSIRMLNGAEYRVYFST